MGWGTYMAQAFLQGLGDTTVHMVDMGMGRALFAGRFVVRFDAGWEVQTGSKVFGWRDRDL